MRRLIKWMAAAAVAASGVVVVTGCGQKEQTFQTNVQIARTQVVKSSGGKWIDVELEYPDCPGEQREIFQANAAFADCLAKYKVGDKVPATILYVRLSDGHFDSEVEKIGDCTRKRDVHDERSYEIVHECHDLVVNGVQVGFRCDRKPTPELLAKCPWFKRT
jgi:hypothetical protein